MKSFLLVPFAVFITACGRPPEVVSWKPTAEPARESVIEFVQKMSAAEVARAQEPFRTWLVAQRTGVCELHDVKMSRRWLPVTYGLPAADSLPEREEAAGFPHGEEVFSGGCVVTATKEREVHLCPECVKAYRVWKAKKPNKAPEPTP